MDSQARSHHADHDHPDRDHRQHDHPQHDRHSAGGEAALAELLDLDAEVLQPHLADVVDWAGQLAAGPPRRILDLGCGTGTGTIALARRFEGAALIAVDVSAAMLDRLRTRAGELGMSGRIRTVQADLDTAWPDTGAVDLAWASSSLHHLKDPDRALAGIFAALPPGGLLAVVETSSVPRFLPDDVGSGLEARCHAALAEGLAGEMPHRGADWGPRLGRAGFTVEAERTLRIDLAPPLPAAARRYARATLTRLRSGLDGRLSVGDLAALGALLDDDGPDSILRRDDLTVRATRDAWVARHPEASRPR